MRLVIAVILFACAIAILIDSPQRGLQAELKADWAEYQQHVGQPSRIP